MARAKRSRPFYTREPLIEHDTMGTHCVDSFLDGTNTPRGTNRMFAIKSDGKFSVTYLSTKHIFSSPQPQKTFSSLVFMSLHCSICICFIFLVSRGKINCLGRPSFLTRERGLTFIFANVLVRALVDAPGFCGTTHQCSPCTRAHFGHAITACV